MNKPCVFILTAFAFLMACSAIAGDSESRSPLLNIDEALAIARAFVKEHQVNVSQKHIESACLDEKAGHDQRKCWIVTWQSNAYVKGGETYLHIDMDGTVRVFYGE